MTFALTALVAVSYIHWIESPAMTTRVTGVEQGVTSIQVSQLEEKMEKTESALCMNRGDYGLLERRRELRDMYQRLTGKQYDAPTCDLLLKINK